MLQYITSSTSAVPVTEQVKLVLEGGCRWIQVDMPDATDEEIGKVIEEIKPLCLEKESFLLLTDRVELAKTQDVGGVHLHKNAMLPSQARLALGPAAVIGVDAENEDDIDAVQALDIDYVGFPVSIGKDKISELCRYMESKNLEMGRVASGDISLKEVDSIMKCGVNGIAVGDLIANSENIRNTATEYIDLSNTRK